MNDFFPPNGIKLNREIVEQGVLFVFHHPTGGPGDLVRVLQSWSSVQTLIFRLRTSRTYCAKDVPLLVWKEGEECVFSGEETERILEMLEGLPNWN